MILMAKKEKFVIGDQGIHPIPMVVTQNIGDIPGQIIIGQNARPNGIINIVIDVGDLVAAANHHTLQRGRPGIAGMTEDAISNLVS